MEINTELILKSPFPLKNSLHTLGSFRLPFCKLNPSDILSSGRLVLLRKMNPLKRNNPTQQKWGVLGTTLNSIRGWGSNFSDMGSVESLFIAITLKSTLSGSKVPSIGQINI